jgi:hypothetical protein
MLLSPEEDAPDDLRGCRAIDIWTVACIAQVSTLQVLV